MDCRCRLSREGDGGQRDEGKIIDVSDEVMYCVHTRTEQMDSPHEKPGGGVDGPANAPHHVPRLSPIKNPHPSEHPHPPAQVPVKVQVPPALVQPGMVGVPEYPALQVAYMQLPTAAFVAVPVQWYPVGAMQATVCMCVWG